MNKQITSNPAVQENILSNLQNPAALEKLYRADKSAFRLGFNALMPGLGNNPVAAFWQARLTAGRDEINWGSGRDLIRLILVCLLAGLIARIPFMLNLEEDLFYARNIGFIVFPILTAYFAWKQKMAWPKVLEVYALIVASAVFINALPKLEQSDTLVLSCIHLLLFLWSLLGYVFSQQEAQPREGRLAYLRYNGDLVVMGTLIAIAGAILVAVSLGLFNLIGFMDQEKYMEYILPFALPAVPILGTYLTQTNPQLVGRVSPVIAKIFSPLVLVMLAAYLLAIVYSGKNPYSDRDFLILFNVLLIGVMAIIFFSIAETGRNGKQASGNWILFLLALLTVMVNGIAISAILFRISSLGFTPNRTAVLGANLLMLVHLLIIIIQLYRTISGKKDLSDVRNAIAQYLPVYVSWTIVVTFLFPFIFGFR
jgi:hypothetical protein